MHLEAKYIHVDIDIINRKQLWIIELPVHINWRLFNYVRTISNTDIKIHL